MRERLVFTPMHDNQGEGSGYILNACAHTSKILKV